MSKAYQVVTEHGLVIPPALCASAQLGGEVLLEIEPGSIAIRPARLSAYEVQRRAAFYALMNIGDAVSINAPILEVLNAREQWNVTVTRKATRDCVGVLALNAETGEVITWTPSPTPSTDAIN